MFNLFNQAELYILHFLCTFATMKKWLILFVQFFLISALYGQTIIDLKPGGGVRSKTINEYRKEEPGMAEKLRTDSLQYKDNLTRAFNALYRDSISQAERLFNEALKLRPNAPSNPIVKHYLARISMARCQYRQAISQLTPLIKDQPENRQLRFDRGSCYLEIKNTKAAMEDCNVIFHGELSQEERIKALFLRSAVYTESRHPDKAKFDLEEILSLDHDNESAMLLLAFAYKDIGQPQEALNRLNLFVASHSQSVDGLIARAELEEELKMDDAARADYDKAIGIAPQNVSLYISRAKLLLRLGLQTLAQHDLKKAVSLGYPLAKASELLPKPEE